jgi:hypothetical protein
MALNRLGEELTDTLTKRPPPPVSVPELAFLKAPLVDDGAERREIADKFAEYRTIRTGVECWMAIGRAESFEAWKRIGAALAVGKAHALRVSGANAAWGRNYSREFSLWVKRLRQDAGRDAERGR